jgi:hypothetical protein
VQNDPAKRKTGNQQTRREVTNSFILGIFSPKINRKLRPKETKSAIETLSSIDSRRHACLHDHCDVQMVRAGELFWHI